MRRESESGTTPFTATPWTEIRKRLDEDKKSSLAAALAAIETGKQPSIRAAAEHYGLKYSTDAENAIKSGYRRWTALDGHHTWNTLLIKARLMTYTDENVKSAFEATGIWPTNERRVLNRNNFDVLSARVVPGTPRHGRAILIHGRRLLSGLPRKTPHSKHRFQMVQQLLKAALRATAENVILNVENENLKQKATPVKDVVKTWSRKELSKAHVITVDDVIRIRSEQEAREQAV